MAACKLMMEWKLPRRMRWRVSAEKNVSTAFNPGAGRRREVEDEARVPRQPGLHLGMLVGGVVVDDGLDHLPGGHLSLNHVEEADELGVPMTLHASADHRAFPAHSALRTAWWCRGACSRGSSCRNGRASKRQPRLSAIQRLDLAPSRRSTAPPCGPADRGREPTISAIFSAAR